MSFKTILATAIIATTGLVGAPALAEPGGHQLIATLRSAGVKVNFGYCPDESGTMGYFAYRTNTWMDARVQICTDVATTTADRWETLRHEAVHVAQKCENPNHGNTFETLTSYSFLKNNSTNSDASFVMSAYPKAKWMIELEAFTLMKHSNYTITKMVNRACFGR